MANELYVKHGQDFKSPLFNSPFRETLLWSCPRAVFYCSLTAKTGAGITAIIVLCAFMTKPVVAQVPSFTDVNADVYAKEIQEAFLLILGHGVIMAQQLHYGCSTVLGVYKQKPKPKTLKFKHCCLF